LGRKHADLHGVSLKASVRCATLKKVYGHATAAKQTPQRMERAMSIRHRFLGVALAVAATVTLLGTGLTVWAQTYGDQPSSGAGQVTVRSGNGSSGATSTGSRSTGGSAGSAVGGSQKPVVASDTPTFSGTVAPGSTEVRLAVIRVPAGNAIRWTAAVDPATGEFTATVPEKLVAGEYALYVNDTLVGSFIVAP
jgi:hypothetical protein